MLSIPVATALICNLLGSAVSASPLNPHRPSWTGSGSVGASDAGAAISVELQDTVDDFDFTLDLTPSGAKFDGTWLLPTVMAVYDWMVYHIPADGHFTEINVPWRHGIGMNITKTTNKTTITDGASGKNLTVNSALAWMALAAAQQLQGDNNFVESTGIGYSHGKEFGRISIHTAPVPLEPGETIPSTDDDATTTRKRSRGLQSRGLGPWHYDRTLSAHIITRKLHIDVPFPALLSVLANWSLQHVYSIFKNPDLGVELPDLPAQSTLGPGVSFPGHGVSWQTLDGGRRRGNKPIVEALLYVSEFQVNQPTPVVANTTFFLNGTASFALIVD